MYIKINAARNDLIKNYYGYFGTEAHMYVRIKDENRLLKDPVNLAETQYEGRLERIEDVKVGDQLTLVQVSNNKYDSNAIDVRNNEGSLGLIDKNYSHEIGSLLSTGKVTYNAYISSVTPVSKRSKRARTALIAIKVELEINEKAVPDEIREILNADEQELIELLKKAGLPLEQYQLFNFEEEDDNNIRTWFNLDQFYCKTYGTEREILKIPSSYGNKPVTILDFNKGFIDNYAEKLEIPSTIEKIDYSKYDFASGLNELIIDENNKVFATDGKALFNRDMTVLYRMFVFNIEEYSVPEGVVTIEENAFGYCQNLSKLILPSTIRELKKEAFNDCIKLSEIEGLEYLSSIGDNVFIGVPYWKQSDVIILGKTLLKYGKKDESRYIVPENIEEIGSNAFYVSGKAEDDNLEEIILPSSLKIIKRSAFSNRKKLKKMIIPEGVTRLERRCFSDCENLESVVLPQSLEFIGEMAFENCYSLKDIVIPENVSYIGRNAFPLHKTSEILDIFEGVTVVPDNKNFSSSQGCLYSKDGSILYYVPDNYPDETFSVPSEVSLIKSDAFYKNRNIKTLIFEGAVEHFENECFYLLESLKTVIFNDEQRNIVLEDNDPGRLDKVTGLFVECKALSDVILPKKLEIIGERTFYNCSIESVNLPDGLKEIQDSAFEGNKIKKVVLPKSLEFIGGNIFAGNLSEVTLYDSMEDNNRTYLWDGFCENPYKLESNIGRIGIPKFVIGTRGQDMAKWDRFNIVVLSADNDTEKYVIKMPSSSDAWDECFRFISSWKKKACFDIGKINPMFSDPSELAEASVSYECYALERLRIADNLNDELRDLLLQFAKKHFKKSLSTFDTPSDLRFIKDAEYLGLITSDNINEVIRIVNESGNEYIEEYLDGSDLKKDKKERVKNEDVLKGYKKLSEGGYTDALEDYPLDSFEFCQTRFRGLIETIQILTEYLEKYNIRYQIKQDAGKDIKEIELIAVDHTLELVDEFPALKATSLLADFNYGTVSVLYSESGANVFTDIQSCPNAFFDPSADSSWVVEQDMIKPTKGYFYDLHTGDKVRYFYDYPDSLKQKWDDLNFAVK